MVESCSEKWQLSAPLDTLNRLLGKFAKQSGDFFISANKALGSGRAARCAAVSCLFSVTLNTAGSGKRQTAAVFFFAPLYGEQRVLPKMGVKKAANLFLTYCLCVPL
ncbi:MAG: hypothetical protein MR459_18680 [Enterocloster aldenensis]|nr:hypothetical protein [Enterocloster aldenensis]